MSARRTNRRGGAAVEFALVLPVLLTFVSGIIDFGWYLQQRSAVVMATQDGARAAVLAGTSGDPTTAATNRVKADLIAAGITATPTVTATAATVGQPITVSASVPFAKPFGLVPTPNTLAYASAMLMTK